MTLLFTLVVSWYRQPLDAITFDGRWQQLLAFDLEGAVPAAYALVALAAGAAAGTLMRRSFPALAVTLGAYIALRTIVAAWLRPRFQPPLTTVTDTSHGIWFWRRSCGAARVAT